MTRSAIVPFSLVLTLLNLCSSAPTTRIIEGSSPKVGQFPYAVFVLMGDTVCTGSLIQPHRVLTAAHCCYGKPPISYSFFGGVCFAGEVSIIKGDLSKSKSIQTRLIWQFVIHPDFKGHHVPNDVAILSLRSPFNLNQNVATIKLAEEELKKDDECISLGFGFQFWSISSAFFPQQLLTDLAWFKSKVFEVGCKEGKSLCTRSKGKATYKEDSGGPLIRKMNENIVYGVASFLLNPKHPFDGVAYASVAENRKWILENLDILERINPAPRTIAKGPRFFIRHSCLIFYVLFEMLTLNIHVLK